jgi:hypothetical protein
MGEPGWGVGKKGAVFVLVEKLGRGKQSDSHFVCLGVEDGTYKNHQLQLTNPKRGSIFL